MPYLLSKWKDPIYLASLHCFLQRWDSVRHTPTHTKKKKAEHLTKRMIKHFFKDYFVASFDLVSSSWVLSVLSNSLFISTLIQFNPLLFKKNCDLGKYHIRSFIKLLLRREKNDLRLDNFILGSFASLVFWTHQKVVTFRYVPRTQPVVF